jgi:hypothetical protein
MRIRGFVGRWRQDVAGTVIASGEGLPTRASRSRERVQEAIVRLRWDQLVLPIVFFFVSGRWFASYIVGPGSLGFDARLYAAAARARSQATHLAISR